MTVGLSDYTCTASSCWRKAAIGADPAGMLAVLIMGPSIMGHDLPSSLYPWQRNDHQIICMAQLMSIARVQFLGTFHCPTGFRHFLTATSVLAVHMIVNRVIFASMACTFFFFFFFLERCRTAEISRLERLIVLVCLFSIHDFFGRQS